MSEEKELRIGREKKCYVVTFPNGGTQRFRGKYADALLPLVALMAWKTKANIVIESTLLLSSEYVWDAGHFMFGDGIDWHVDPQTLESARPNPKTQET